MELFFTGKGHEVGIMVVIQVRRGSIKTLDGVARVASLSDAEVVRQQVAEGLRAEVKSSSPIAGQKSIALDFHPEREPRFTGIQTPYPEVPTAASGMERLNEKIEETLKKISEIPIDEVVTQLRDTLQSAQLLLDSGDLRGRWRTWITLRRQRDAEARGRDDGRHGRARRPHANDHDHTSDTEALRAAVENMNRTLATVDRNVRRTAERSSRRADARRDRELMKSLRYRSTPCSSTGVCSGQAR